ncbi:MAG: hypothetical protein RLY20_159 [Verrucomicrobiota bacterium]|jgi:cytochrome oxidase Cu insertion factor (SCO1/SenC/PrrC family)
MSLPSLAKLLCVLCILSCAAVQASTNATERISESTNRCAQFTLEDQFQKSHDFKFPRDKPTVLTVADRKGADGIVNWAHPLAEKFGDKITIAGLADVSSVPGPLHGLVRSKFKKVITFPVMLDWDGDATKSFNYTKSQANVYLISTDGRVLHHFAGTVDEEQLKKLMTLIESEIATKAKK